MNAGTRTRSDRFSGLAGSASFAMSANSFRSFSRTFLCVKARKGCEPRSNSCSAVISLALRGLMPVS